MKYRLENHVIDTSLFRISSDGRDIPAEPRVFDLLVYLIRHRDRVVSRDELFREVWDGRIVTDATLSNHIKSVRKLLGDDGEQQRIILTVRGRGYQFIGEVEEFAPEAGGDAAASAVRAAPGAETGAVPTPARRRYVTLAAMVLLGLFVTAFALWRDDSQMQLADAADRPYILVVPFDVSAAVPEDWEPFADQFTREVIRNLRKISGLRVVPPPSAFTFSDNKARDHIRNQLPDVGYVLDGVVSVGTEDAIRITLELENLQNDDEVVWDRPYETRIDSTRWFTVQSEIAADVSGSLQVVVLEDEQRTLAELPTENLAAYEAYVAGGQQVELVTHDSLRRAVSLFDQAIALDPGFTAAYIARANASRLLMTYYEAPANMLDEVVRTIQQALDLDRDSAEARSSLGLAYVHAWRWEDAWLLLNEAKVRDPGLALTELGFALYYSGLGDAEGVRRSLANANRLDPLNIELADWGQWALAMVGEVDAAMAWAEEKMRQHPYAGVVYSGAGVAASLAGDHERAIELAEKGARLDENAPLALITLAEIYGAAGQTDRVLPLLEQAHGSGEYVCPYESAAAYLTLDDTEKVFELLDDAVEYRSNCLIFLRNDPRLEPIRDDPRYATLLVRVGLDDTALDRYAR